MSPLFLVLTVSCGVISAGVGVGVLVRRLRKSKPFKSLSFRRTRASLGLELLPTHTKSHTLLPQSPSLESLKLSPPSPSPYRPLTPNPARISSPDIQTHRRSRSLGGVRHSPPSLIDFSTSSSSTSSDLGTFRHSHTLALPQPLPSPPNDTWQPKERDLLVFSPPPLPHADKDAIPLIDLSALTPPRNRELPPSRSVSPSPIRSSPNPGIIIVSPLDGSHSPPPTSQQESQESVRGWERAWTHDWDHKPASSSRSTTPLAEPAPRSASPVSLVHQEEDVSAGWDPVWADDLEAGLESPEQDLIRFAPDETQPQPADQHDDLKHQPITDAWSHILGSSPPVFTASPAPMSDISLSPPPPAIQVMSPVESDSESEVQVQDSYTEVVDEAVMEKGTASKDGWLEAVEDAREPPVGVVIGQDFDGALVEAGLSEAMGDFLSIDDTLELVEEIARSGVEEPLSPEIEVVEPTVEEAGESVEGVEASVEEVQEVLPIQSKPEFVEPSVEEAPEETLQLQSTPELLEPSVEEELLPIQNTSEIVDESVTEEREELVPTAPSRMLMKIMTIMTL
ncbi:hypothetical protein BD779DRAFT_442163 [Infundibulicybe gibba]|nr:hypothetical protein BD779DRAFT_442163 [Infundibulicybe gibba]